MLLYMNGAIVLGLLIRDRCERDTQVPPIANPERYIATSAAAITVLAILSGIGMHVMDNPSSEINPPDSHKLETAPVSSTLTVENLQTTSSPTFSIQQR